MISIKPIYLEKFNCLMGECPDSCCQHWEIDVDSDSLKNFTNTKNKFETSNRAIINLKKDEYGNDILKLTNDIRCPFLNDSNLCDLHCEQGVEKTPITCRTFPKFFHYYGNIEEIGINLSCPQICNEFFKLDSIFQFEKNEDERLPDINNIDALTFYKIKTFRSKCFDKIDGSDSLKNIIISILCDASDLQKELFDEINNNNDDQHQFHEIFELKEVVNDKYYLMKFNEAATIEDTVLNRNILKTYIYKYCLDSIFDHNLETVIKFSIISVLVNCILKNSSDFQLWSKETEHSQKNIEDIFNKLNTYSCFSLENFKKII